MRTKAVADGDDWVLTGTKCWMSGVVQADWYCVFAKTGPADSRAHDSISCFIVERSWPGVSVGRTDHKMGVKGVDTGELVLDGVRVRPRTSSARSAASALAMLGLNSMRPVVAARGLGLAEGALMYAVEYVKQRAAFGKTIADMQGVQWKIAELATEIEAARLLTYRSAWMADRGQYTKEFVPYLSLASTRVPENAEPHAPPVKRCRCSARPGTWKIIRPRCGTGTRSSSRSSKARRRFSSGSSSGRARCDLWYRTETRPIEIAVMEQESCTLQGARQARAAEPTHR